MARRYKFNKKLWSRFIAVGQPFFFPAAPKQTQVFIGLGIILLLSLIALGFFLTVGLTLLGQLILPNFILSASSELIDQVNNSLRSPIPYIAGVTIVIASLVFLSQKSKLEGRWRQWFLLGLLLFLLFTSTSIKVLISYALNLITTSLNQRNEDAFWQSIVIIAIIFSVATPVFVIYNYSQKKLGLLWREWLAKHFLDRYFQPRISYQLNDPAIKGMLDNPDQRMTEDIKSFTTVTLDLCLQFLDSIITLLSFAAVLYGISAILTVGLLVYALLGTILAIAIGNRLINVNYNQFRLEANLRYGLVRVRDHSESVAFYQGEKLEEDQVLKRLIAAIKNFDILIVWESIINFFQKSYEYLILLFPYFVIAPLYFSGEVEFGEFTQADFAFATLLFALSFIVTRVQVITGYAASINRLGELNEALINSFSLEQRQETVIVEPTEIDYEKSDQVEFQHLTLKTPDCTTTLIRDLSLAVPPLSSLLIMGASGVGKSSLLRAIAQLWTSGQGVITHPPLEEILFLPQRPYMIMGTLRGQLLYPNPTPLVSDRQLQEILDLVQLPNLLNRFPAGWNAQEDWENILSLGEQQRIALARVIVNRPRYAILDEATSALDTENEKLLYQTIAGLGTTYISVGHRNTLKQYHQKLLTILEDGRWEIQSLNH